MPSGIPMSGKRAPRGSRSTSGTFYVVKSARPGGDGVKASRQKVVIIPRCSHDGCEKGAVSGGVPGLCISHGGGRRCNVEGCPKSAAGPTNFCVAHGGGKRCASEGCSRQPNRGGFCRNHGVAKCKFPKCTKVEKGGGYCCRHGGGRRCQFGDCQKHNVGGGFCIAHGGGKRCTFDSCARQDIGGGFCRQHGGGFTCAEADCTKLSLTSEKYCRNHLKARSFIDIMLSAAHMDGDNLGTCEIDSSPKSSEQGDAVALSHGPEEFVSDVSSESSVKSDEPQLCVSVSVKTPTNIEEDDRSADAKALLLFTRSYGEG